MAEINRPESGPIPLFSIQPTAVRCFFAGVAIGVMLLFTGGLTAEAEARPAGVQAPAEEPTAVAETVTIARATWDTGWFQTEIFVELIEALRYAVAPPKTMANLPFYLAAARGQVDLWVNGWFPSHQVFLNQEEVSGKVTPVGFEVADGALQGYLVNKHTADELGITNLGDLKRPEVAAAFDRNGDGRADLIGGNVGWGCERVVEHHLGVYELRDTVEHVQGDYSPLMDETIERYHRGEPVLFYTWTPNWTVGKLVPGKDVVWLQVPFASLPFEQQDLEERTFVEAHERGRLPADHRQVVRPAGVGRFAPLGGWEAWRLSSCRTEPKT